MDRKTLGEVLAKGGYLEEWDRYDFILACPKSFTDPPRLYPHPEMAGWAHQGYYVGLCTDPAREPFGTPVQGESREHRAKAAGHLAVARDLPDIGIAEPRGELLLPLLCRFPFLLLEGGGASSLCVKPLARHSSSQAVPYPGGILARCARI